MLIMAGVLGQLIGPQKKAMYRSDLKALELQVAKEILAEVFRVRLSDVDEMIQNRFHSKLPAPRIWPLKKMGCGHRNFGWKAEAIYLSW